MTNAISAATNDDGRASPSQPSSSLPYKYDIASYQQVRYCTKTETKHNMLFKRLLDKQIFGE